MDALKQFTDLVSERYGAIDNVKFLVGSRSDLTKEDVMCQLANVAAEVASGTCVPTSGFHEPGLNNTKIDFVAEALLKSK